MDDGWLGVLVGLNWDRVAENVTETWRWTMMDDKAKMNAKQKPAQEKKKAKDKGKQKQPPKKAKNSKGKLVKKVAKKIKVQAAKKRKK